MNPVSAMVSMITNARQFQMQTKLLETADKNDQSANQAQLRLVETKPLSATGRQGEET